MLDLFTLDRNFVKQDEIDTFESVIWTERYYGDSEVELIVPATKEMIQRLQIGTFLGFDGTDEIMILETHDIDTIKGELKLSGVSLLKFLNNRFIRTSSNHADRYWTITGYTAGYTLWNIIYWMCYEGSSGYPLGVSNPQLMKIPGLTLMSADDSGSAITVAVPFGPVYDALKQIATTYQIGMSITLEPYSRSTRIIAEGATDVPYSIQFRSYRGLNRTSNQQVNPIVRFSPKMESFTNIKELQSIAGYKTQVYSYAPANPAGLTSAAGFDSLDGSSKGFDLRLLMIFAEDITTDMVGGSATVLLNALNQRASDALDEHKFVKYVDGEIVPTSQFKYGIQYNLGDIIEVEGTSGAVQHARVTEYIHAQDNAGERAYPTVTMIE